MAEVAPSSSGGGGGRRFLLIVGGLAAVLFIGLLALGAVTFLPSLFGGGGQAQQAAVVSTATPTRIVIPPTATRTPLATATRVVVSQAAPVLSPGQQAIALELAAGKNVTLTTYEGGKQPMVQKGTWSFDAGQKQLVLTFVTLNDKPFKDEIIFGFQDDKLVPVTYNRALHQDLSGIQLQRQGGPSSNNLAPSRRNVGVSMPAAQATATPDPLLGNYGATLPAPAQGEHLARLALNADNSAILAVTEAGKPSTLQLGTWKADGNTVTVSLTDKDGKPFEQQIVLTAKDNQLVSDTTQGDLPPFILTRDANSPTSANAPLAGTYSVDLAAPTPVTATPIPITATPIAITATPDANNQDNNLPDTGLGEDLLMLFGGAVLLLGVIIVVRRMRAAA